VDNQSYVNLIHDYIKKNKFKNLDRSTLLKILHLFVESENDFKIKLLDMSDQVKSTDKEEYLNISLNSIYSDMIKNKFEEKVITNFYTLYKYKDYFTIYLNENINKQKSDKVLEKIDEIKPNQVVISYKNSKTKKILLNKENFSPENEEKFYSFLKPNCSIRLVINDESITFE